MNYACQSELSLPFIAVPLSNEPEKQCPSGSVNPPGQPRQPCHFDTISFAIFFLLLVQFGNFYAAGDLQGLQLSAVHGSICLFLFIPAAYFYRVALTEMGLPDDMIAMIFPEICIVLCMGTASFYNPMYAFLLLLVSKLMFVVVGVIVYAILVCDDKNDEDVTCKHCESQESMA